MSAVPDEFARKVMQVDWPAIFASLRKCDVSVYDVARRTGISRSALRDYGAGISQPRHHIGELIILLWSKETHQERQAVPMVSSYWQAPMI